MLKLENKKILLAEDDNLMSEILVGKFMDEKAIVTRTGDGETTLNMAKSNKYDLILLDLLLPKIDGYKVLEELKNNDETKNIAVVILSNLGQRVDVEKAIKLGAKKFLVKSLLSADEIVRVASETITP
jgi:DNA-binding response OmpR family regulator